MPELSEINAGGSADIFVKGFSGDKLTLDFGGAVKSTIETSYDVMDIKLTGASKMNLLASTSKVRADLSGASKMDLQGVSKEIELDISGASKVLGFEMHSHNADVEASGASQAEVSVDNVLTVEASGASKVFYKGDPRIFQKNSGNSNIQSFDSQEIKKIDFEVDIDTRKEYNIDSQRGDLIYVN